MEPRLGLMTRQNFLPISSIEKFFPAAIDFDLKNML